MIKIITGVRRCGKSYLLSTLFKEYQLESGVPPENIIELSFDGYANKKLRDPDAACPYIRSRLREGQNYLLPGKQLPAEAGCFLAATL